MVNDRPRRGYCLDTSALIDLWRVHYPPDVFPGIWRDLEGSIRKGRIVAPMEVLRELRARDDELLAWAEGNDTMFITLDEAAIATMGRVIRDFPRLVDPDRTTPDADPFVIALALQNDHRVVTSEKATANPDKPRIPDVCKANAVRCITIPVMFRELGLRYE